MNGSATIMVFWCLVIAISGFSKAASASEKSTFEDQVKVEHAEIVLPTEDFKMARAYLVIWNGTASGINVVSIKGQDGLARLVKAKNNSDGQVEIVPSSMPRYIPPQSEFTMKESGHYLMVPIKSTAKKISNYLFSVELSSGRTLIAIADILAAGTTPLDHHHGSKDNECVIQN